MAVVEFEDIELPEDDCECDLDDQCCDKGCLFRIKVGPCTAFNKATGEVNMALMCTPKNVTVHTPNFIIPLLDKNYRNSCDRTRINGTRDCNIDIDFDICQTDPAIKYLLSDCPITICMVPRADRYDFALPSAAQNTLTYRGLFKGSDWSHNNDFEDCQGTSRNFSCTSRIWGLQEWLNNLPGPQALVQNGDFESERKAA